MKRGVVVKWLGRLIFSLIILLLGIGQARALDLPKVIDKTNCSQYKDLLIPALYRAVERGEWIITPGQINFKYKQNDGFLAASAKNEGKFDVTHEGDLVDKHTGKYPENIYGYPFPNIDLKDPKVGAKIIYNFDFQRYRFMGSKDKIYLQWINIKGEERYIAGMDYRLYLNGRPPDKELKNPDKVLTYEFQRVLEPMSTKGTNTMACIYMGAKQDTNFAYVPAIRRIRQTGSTARSDPYMGSDSWMDMNFMWGGKTSTMKWEYVGEKTILAPFTSPNMIPVKELPDGSMTRAYPYTGNHPKCGYEDPNWKGASWAPLNITYVPRKVWIVEQMPKDPYYNWGKHVNYVDQESYTIWYKEVYDRAGEFRTWVSLSAHYSETPSGKNNTGDFDSQVYIDEKSHHATTVSRSSDPESFLFLPASKLDPSFFSTNNFLLLSK
ncbi:MAG: DUF1329 domain-containing protein [Proteobacteria bacterium]|nr:DUF1329 domain-containing protein [Pseudomonadota bacterium]MBU4036526.1 DUF1329 domain-containing protein [Pseudomonadota bacterium]